MDCQEQWADGCVGLGGRGWRQDQCLERAPAGGLGRGGGGQISTRYKRDMCMFISCVYNKSDMHRYRRSYTIYFSADINKICVCLYLVYIINQICTDIDVHIRLYF